MIRVFASFGRSLYGVRVSPPGMTGSDGVQQITSTRAVEAVSVGYAFMPSRGAGDGRRNQ